MSEIDREYIVRESNSAGGARRAAVGGGPSRDAVRGHLALDR